MELDTFRKSWNRSQAEFRRMLLVYDCPELTGEMFLRQHGALHSKQVAPDQTFSYEEAVFGDANEEQMRRIPRNEEHSMAWCLWHLARIEDVTMNILISGEDQLFERDGWAERLGVNTRDTGNALSTDEIAGLSASVDLPALRAYRNAVGNRTRQIVPQLTITQLRQKVDPSRLQRIRGEGAVCEASLGLLDYWGGRDLAGLLLMPPTRHNFIHLNEALRLKKKRI
jgi:hypothetical protein